MLLINLQINNNIQRCCIYYVEKTGLILFPCNTARNQKLSHGPEKWGGLYYNISCDSTVIILCRTTRDAGISLTIFGTILKYLLLQERQRIFLTFINLYIHVYIGSPFSSWGVQFILSGGFKYKIATHRSNSTEILKTDETI